MKAIVLKQPGDPANLEIQHLPKPAIQNGEVLVQVKAISINPVDVKTRLGKAQYARLQEQGPVIIGWDISGIVTESKSDLFKPGDEVFGMVNFPGAGKAYAEYVAAPAGHLALKPANISHEEAAAATLAALTAYQAVAHQYKIKAGDRVLIHAAAGGVGHFAVQLAKHMGAYVIGTSSARNKDFVLKLGADEHIDYQTNQLETHQKDFDFILDAIGGNNVDRSLPLVKPGGTLICLPSAASGGVTEKSKAYNVNGFFFMVQSSGADMKVIAGYLQKGIIKAHVSKTFPFENMADAHTYVETGRTVGKVVVVL
jgi:NADPH:quinone reductase-like Zn-dependent oxidoreductase